MRALKIGILNVMHDKLATNQRLRNALTASGLPVELHFYYPTQHYQDRPVPEAVSAILQPLDLALAADMDGFIITGAPIETIAFDDVTYIEELRALLATLDQHHVTQLYLCWGAMAALDYFYKIRKDILPHKLFGVYPQKIRMQTPLLTGLRDGFTAPHARYAEMNQAQIARDPDLTVAATTVNDELFLVENAARRQTFLFAHLEYGRLGLMQEYEREVAAHPERTYRKPENYFADPAAMCGPEFSWADTQRLFFANWLTRVQEPVAMTEH
ncbi:homoserine O-acetyltransferase/O-succinyltransferase family protein [Lacticaseibacillus yichunensis]|uniref:Serine O-acetyltransferase n=2 Tax=Bacilli TaxID=91061 RepID=A0ABW4CS23_9LACO|nr:homoserine O-succinyltransferase [Lacticaseibacillus yichunensis]